MYLSADIRNKVNCLNITTNVIVLDEKDEAKETILRKSEYQQKVLKFKKTSPLSQNLFIESRFLNGSTAPISVSKRFHSERI